MKTLPKILRPTLALALMLALPALSSARGEPAKAPPGAKTPTAAKPRPTVQIAVLLDTSSSMDGLISQAKDQLWRIVNTFVLSERGGQRPDIEVALYEYGNDKLSSKSGWIRQVLPLTTDLDKVSEELFALTTDGGSEHCGQVILRAVNDLKWSRDPKDLKVIFIAGNEPFTQGPVKYQRAVKRAIRKGVLVNTIHCGPRETGARTGWLDAARLADGSYAFIDQNRAAVHIEAPQDDEIARLGTELNKTYVVYGKGGGAYQARQLAQDSNAASTSKMNSVNRSMFKASANYSNPGWDLVDAVREGKVKLDALDEKEIPKELKGLNTAERKAFLDAKRAERGRLQARIKALQKARTTFVAEKRKAMASKGAKTLDEAVITSVRSQAAKRGFRFE